MVRKSSKNGSKSTVSKFRFVRSTFWLNLSIDYALRTNDAVSVYNELAIASYRTMPASIMPTITPPISTFHSCIAKKNLHVL